MPRSLQRLRRHRNLQEPAEVADSVLVAVEEDFAEPGNMSLCVGSVVTALISGLPQKVIYPYTVHPKMAI